MCRANSRVTSDARPHEGFYVGKRTIVELCKVSTSERRRKNIVESRGWSSFFRQGRTETRKVSEVTTSTVKKTHQQ